VILLKLPIIKPPCRLKIGQFRRQFDIYNLSHTVPREVYSTITDKKKRALTGPFLFSLFLLVNVGQVVAYSTREDSCRLVLRSVAVTHRTVVHLVSGEANYRQTDKGVNGWRG